MDARSKLDEYAEMQGWNKNKLIGWSEAADFGEWLVKTCSISAVSVEVCPKCGYNKMTGDGTKSWCLNEICDFVEAD
jgi:hypothetical protein